MSEHWIDDQELLALQDRESKYVARTEALEAAGDRLANAIIEGYLANASGAVIAALAAWLATREGGA